MTSWKVAISSYGCRVIIFVYARDEDEAIEQAKIRLDYEGRGFDRAHFDAKRMFK